MVRELPETLPQQMRVLLPDESSAVSADEAMALGARVTGGEERQALALRGRFQRRMLNPKGSRRPAWAWLAVVVLLVVVLVFGFRVAFPSKSVPIVPAHPAPVSVDLAATPSGWVPVDYKNLQLSVPASWAFATAHCPGHAPAGEVFLQGIAPTTKPCQVPLSSVTVATMQDSATSRLPSHSEELNGIEVYFAGGKPNSSMSITGLVPNLGVQVTIDAHALNTRILHTFSYSPRAVALAGGPRPPVPSSWHSVTFAGLSMSVPADWPVKGEEGWGSPTGIPSDLTFADLATSSDTSTVDTSPSVILDTGVYDFYVECGGCVPPTRGASGWDTTPIDGLLIDSGNIGPSLDDVPSRAACLHLNGLTACPTANDVYGVLVISADFDGSPPIPVEIGLSGDGIVARTILDSIHTSDANPTVTTPTTVPVKLSPWPQRAIASGNGVQDIAPTSNGVYWLNVLDGGTGHASHITPVRYNPATGQMTKGAWTTGFAGSPAITVTGGWVWMVVGVGEDVVVEQRDPVTLAIRSSQSLPVKDNLFGPQVAPSLTATVNGPLWIAGGEDLWALNPATGTVETEFDTGDQISSMSTDPTGSLLYTAGQSDASTNIVTEYSAQTGTELNRSDQPYAVSAGSVAATNSGVWVSIRTGMAGSAFELSAHGLSQIAPPPSKGGSFGTYTQIMGIGSSISEQTLWLTNYGGPSTLTCADPTTGAVRASEPTSVAVFAPIASGNQVYAVTASGSVLVITPPAKCFG